MKTVMARQLRNDFCRILTPIESGEAVLILKGRKTVRAHYPRIQAEEHSGPMEGTGEILDEPGNPIAAERDAMK
jgi:antitoxin (DNA-binding transcriptional repressor) of toxin-antitoxin stability system